MYLLRDKWIRMVKPFAHFSMLQHKPGVGNAHRNSLIVGIVLCAHFFLSVSAKLDNSNTFDEIAHITSGYSQLRTGDYRLNPEGGVLSQTVQALPLLFFDLDFVDESSKEWKGANLWSVGDIFFFRKANPLDHMLLASRAAACVLSVLLGILVYYWSLKVFGWYGGFLSLCLYAFSPTILAHAALATTDISSALFFMASTISFWIFLSKLNCFSFLVCGLCCGALFLTKMSAPLIIPVFFFLTAHKILFFEPSILALGGQRISLRNRIQFSAIGLAATFFVLATAYGVIWLWYTSMSTSSANFQFPWNALRSSSLSSQIVDYLRLYNLLPESYLFGSLHAMENTQFRESFLDGVTSLTGRVDFFSKVFAYKTGLTLLSCTLVALTTFIMRALQQKKMEGQADPRIYSLAPMLYFSIFYFAVASFQKLNIGHRHILPIYPALFVSCGYLATLLPKPSIIKRTLFASIVAGLLSIEALVFWPSYLSYFNPLFGNYIRGHHRLVDSSVDWGQDLPELARWYRENRLQERGSRFYLSYFGSAEPRYYGISFKALPSFLDRNNYATLRPLRPGWYAISVTMLEALYLDPFGEWNQSYEDIYRNLKTDMGNVRESQKFSTEELRLFAHLRFAKLCSYLRTRQPEKVLNDTIYIYNLTSEDLHLALDQVRLRFPDSTPIAGFAGIQSETTDPRRKRKLLYQELLKHRSSKTTKTNESSDSSAN